MDFDRALSQNQTAEAASDHAEQAKSQAALRTVEAAQAHFDQRVPSLFAWLVVNGARPGKIAYGHAKLPRQSPVGVLLDYSDVGPGYTLRSSKRSAPRRPKAVTVLLPSGRIFYGSKADILGGDGHSKEGDAYLPRPVNVFAVPSLAEMQGRNPTQRWDLWFEATAVQILENHCKLGL